MRRLLLSLIAPLALFTPFAAADVEFTYPAAGASIPAGALTIKWTDSGTAPTLKELSSYTLTLLVGGNDATNAVSFASCQPFRRHLALAHVSKAQENVPYT